MMANRAMAMPIYSNIPVINDEFKNLRKSITCPICLDYFSFPVTLACNHSFCQSCISDAVALRNSCPICSVRITKKAYMQQKIELEEVILLVRQLIIGIDVNECDNASYPLPRKQDEKFISGLQKDPVPIDDSNEEATIGEGIDDKQHHNHSNIVNLPTFNIEEIVNVLPRCWPGINKPGGIAWIKNFDVENKSCDVRYIVGGNDLVVPMVFIEKYDGLARTSRRSRPSLNETGDNACGRKSSDKEDKISTSKRRRVLSDIPITLATNTTISKQSTAKSRRKMEHVGHDTMTEELQIRPDNHTIIPPEEHITKLSTMTIVSSSLSADEASALESFASRFPDVILSSRFDRSTTHLVVHVDHDGVLNQRTMKYLQSIVAGIWVLSADWLHDCLASASILPEKQYEVHTNSKAIVQKAALRARVSTKLIVTGKKVKLFHDITAHIFGSFPSPGPPKSDLEYLLHHGGAMVCGSTEEMVSSAHDRHHVSIQHVVICADGASRDTFLKNVSVSSRMKPVIVNLMWVLDCITNYLVMDPQLDCYAVR